MKELKSAVFDLKEDKASEIGADVNTFIDDINKTVRTIEKFEGEKEKLEEKTRKELFKTSTQEQIVTN